MKRLAVLGYHKIGPPPPGGWESWYYIPEAAFAAHLAYLAAAGWEVIDADAFLRGVETPETLPDQAAMITFDDGYRSNRRYALPALREYGYPAVLFVPTDYIGGSNTFDGGAEPEEPICDWDDLNALQSAGVSVQSHGASHRAFSALSGPDLEDELHRSRRCLEEGLGTDVSLFSYPYGDAGTDTGATTAALGRAGYRAAFLYGGAANPVPVPGRYGIERLAMGPETDLESELGRPIFAPGGSECA